MRECLAAIGLSCIVSTAAYSIHPYNSKSEEPTTINSAILSASTIQLPESYQAGQAGEDISLVALAPVPLPDDFPALGPFPIIPLPPTKPKFQPPETKNLLQLARKYLGTNPTGWPRLWCARFMAMIAPEKARKVKNPNMARAWAALPKTTAKVGAIVVLKRGASRTAGHIGVVSGFDKRGNPRVVSGNHNRKVGEGVYAKSRVLAYLAP